MPVLTQIRGTRKLNNVSRALREAGDSGKGLKKELTKGISRATKPLRLAAKASAVATLPTRGGLGARVAKTQMSTRTRLGRDPAVRISVSKNAVKAPRRMDQGRIRHPVFGRAPWVLQDVPRGWFTRPLEKGAPIVRPELIKAMDDVARKIARA